jgi:hypothetical protein
VGEDDEAFDSGEETPVWDISGEIEIAPGPSPTTPKEAPAESTPVEEDEQEGTIPPAPLWAMKIRRHFVELGSHGDAERIRAALGLGDGTVYFMDDGRSHCMIGRRVGSSPDGPVYCLVGRVPIDTYVQAENGEKAVADSFDDAKDIALCSVFEDEGMSSEVILVQHYRHLKDVPTDYLPLSPFIEFEDDLPADS